VSDLHSHQRDENDGSGFVGLRMLATEVAKSESRHTGTLEHRHIATPDKNNLRHDKDELEREKLELDVAEAKFRQTGLPRKQKHERDKEGLELQKLKQEILEKRLLNKHKRMMDRLEARKAELEIEEKRLATKRTTIFWDIVKYGIAVLPVVATVIGLYLTYQKDTAAFRHQVELAQKFTVDDRVLTLIKNLSNTKSPIEAANAALALPAYGRAAIRIIIRHLKLHTDWSSPFLVAALTDVLANEADGSKKQEMADEIVQTLADEVDVLVKNLLLVPGELRDEAKKATVKVHLDALTHVHDRCASACAALRMSLRNRADRIEALLANLEARSKDLQSDLLGSVKQVQAMLTSVRIVK
jgi:hypothetical protein